MDSDARTSTWRFLTDHHRVLVCLANDRDVGLRGLADELTITERRAFDIVNGLAAAGYVIRPTT